MSCKLQITRLHSATVGLTCKSLAEIGLACNLLRNLLGVLSARLYLAQIVLDSTVGTRLGL